MAKLWELVALDRYEAAAQNPPREPGMTRLARVPTIENAEPLVDLRTMGGRFRIRAPLPWLRETVARMLVEASKALPPGYRIGVHTCFRTLKIQEDGYNRYRAHLAKKHPEWPTNILNREAARFFHPPHAKAPPGHTTGGAVDVNIVSPRNRVVYMGGNWRAGPSMWRTFSPDVPEEGRRNRAALYEIMSGVGFSNCYDEWWHWSYGDVLWAYRTGASHAIYGIVTQYPAKLLEDLARYRPRRPRLLRQE